MKCGPFEGENEFQLPRHPWTSPGTTVNSVTINVLLVWRFDLL